MKNLRKLSREESKGIVAGEICPGGKCVPYGGGSGGGDSYTCICPWETFTQPTPCPEFYCITG